MASHNLQVLKHGCASASLGVVLLWGFRCSSISSRLTNFILSSYVSTSGYSCIWRHISCIFKTPTSWLTDELNSILHPQYKDYLPPPGHTDFWTQSLCLSEVGIQSQSVRFRHLKSRECIWEDFKKIKNTERKGKYPLIWAFQDSIADLESTWKPQEIWEWKTRSSD